MHDPELIRDKRITIIARYLAREIPYATALVLLLATGMRENEAKEALS